MVPPVRPALFGSKLSARQRYLSLAVIVGLFGTTFAAYALDIFEVAGGVVFIPGHAALVGVLGAGVIGYQRRGLAVAWAGTYAALLGYSANHYFLGLPGRSLLDRAAAFAQVDGLVVLGLEALILGTVGFLTGMGCRWGIAFVRDGTTQSGASE